MAHVKYFVCNSDGEQRCVVSHSWAARYCTRLLIKLTPKGVVFPFLSFPFLSFPFLSFPFLFFSFLFFPFLFFPFLVSYSNCAHAPYLQ